MKKTISIGLGGRSFIMDEDAYEKLDSYLNMFREKIGNDLHTKEVMEDIENRISELFIENLSSNKEVVDIILVNKIISILGLPDGSDPNNQYHVHYENKTVKKLYRSPDNRVLGGVCNGLAYYLDADVVVIRILAVILLFCGSLGFWTYIIIWFVAPVANTAVQQCEMRGIPVTAENIRRFSNNRR